MAARITETDKKESQLPNNNLFLPNLFLTLKKIYISTSMLWCIGKKKGDEGSINKKCREN